ncbi:MAG TPA: IclR family transcriptional regulator [Gaiellales bacterium]|nr:IclR family transcriptional regulator [Gaiellales bacterium]
MAKVLLKALDILALFDREHPEWAEHEVARELALPTSTTHRLLRSLEGRGYVVRTRAGRYRLGPAAVALGRAAADQAVAPALRAAIERVAAETGKTALLGVRHPTGDGLLILDRIESSHRLRVALDVGHVVPLHAGAASKALLAHLSPAEIEPVVAGPLPRVAPGTITDRAALLRDLERVRRSGHARSCEESAEGGWTVAAPVLGLDGQAEAVVGIIAPVARHSREAEASAVAALSRAVEGAG